MILPNDEEFVQVEEVLAVDPDSTELEPVAGIECDEDDFSYQRDAGEKDPIATIELIAQWSAEGKQGILDWFYIRESGQVPEDQEPNIEHGGALLAFAYEGDEPDLDRTLPEAVTQLNQTLEWFEFELDKEA